jgi:hypothetical protein
MELQVRLSNEIDEHGCGRALCSHLIMQYHVAVFKRRLDTLIRMLRMRPST